MSVKSLASKGQNYRGRSAAARPAWQVARDQDYLEYRRLWVQRPMDCNPGAFPLHLDIETTNYCNLRCIMCPRTKFMAQSDWRWSPKGLGRMDWDTYTSLIDQAAAGGAWSVKLNLLGEPLLHPMVIEQTAYARLAGLYVMMNTNAMLLTPEMSRSLLEAGVTDVFFSVDSPYPEVFERIRPGASFSTVTENIRGFVEIKDELGLDHVQTRASMVTDVLGEFKDQDEAAYQELMQDLGVEEIGFGPEDDHLADHSADNMVSGGGFICEQLFQRMFITWDGAIVPCCGHWERGYVIGRVDETPLAQAWHNHMYSRLRRAHEGGRFQEIPICRKCSVPFLERRAARVAAGGAADAG